MISASGYVARAAIRVPHRGVGGSTPWLSPATSLWPWFPLLCRSSRRHGTHGTLLVLAACESCTAWFDVVSYVGCVSSYVGCVFCIDMRKEILLFR